MKVSLFLGAGASAMFGKPTTVEFLELLPKHLAGDLSGFYAYLKSELRFRDIEDVLQSLKDARLFAKTEMGKLIFTHLPNIKGTSLDFLSLSAKLEHQIESIIKNTYVWNHDHGHDQRLTDTYDKIFQHMRSQTGSIAVFTTNYDTVIETYCRLNKRVCVDGFAGTSDLRKWAGDFDARNADDSVRLYKLHGSLEWKLHKEYGIIMSPELRDGTNLEKDIMIMPTRSPKDEEKVTPFSTIFDLMKKEFGEQDACIVVGYSFRDKSINDILGELMWCGKTVIAVSPTVVKDLSDNLFKQECKSIRGSLGELCVSPKQGPWRVLGFATKFEPNNAAELISKALSVIRERADHNPRG